MIDGVGKMKLFLGKVFFFFFVFIIATSCSSNREGKKVNQPTILSENRQVIAITSTQVSIDTTQMEADLARDYLEEEFSSFEEFQLIDRVDLDRAVEELKFGKSGLVDVSSAGAIGKFLGAKYMVYSKLAKANGIYVITGKLVEVETGKITKTSTGRASSFEKLDGAAKGCARRLTNRMP